MLMKIFVPKREEVTRDGRKLRIDEIHNLYCSLNIVRAIKKDGTGGAGDTQGPLKKGHDFTWKT
jgi:hypothetical protein